MDVSPAPSNDGVRPSPSHMPSELSCATTSGDAFRAELVDAVREAISHSLRTSLQNELPHIVAQVVASKCAPLAPVARAAAPLRDVSEDPVRPFEPESPALCEAEPCVQWDTDGSHATTELADELPGVVESLVLSPSGSAAPSISWSFRPSKSHSGPATKAENASPLKRRMSGDSRNGGSISSYHLAEVERRGWFRSSLAAIMESRSCDGVMCVAIILNAVMMGISADYNVGNSSSEYPIAFSVVERIFSIIFTVELVMRLLAYGKLFFFVDYKWNLFDTMLVLIDFVEIIFDNVIGNSADSSGTVQQLGSMKYLRLLRLCRILRLLRVLRFLSELRAMVLCIFTSFRSLCYTVTLVFLLIYIVAVGLMSLIAENKEALENEVILTHFGSLLAVILSLFEAMTGGISWDVIQRPLADEISPLVSLVFVAYISFAVLCMMNVITGIFVDSALACARADEDKEQRRLVQAFFRQFDQDECLDLERFAEIMAGSEMTNLLSVLHISKEDTEGLFELLDSDDSGSINIEEFVSGCLRLRGNARAIDVATLMYFNKQFSTWMVQRLDSLETNVVAISASQPNPRDRSKSVLLKKGTMESSRSSLGSAAVRERSSMVFDSHKATWHGCRRAGESKLKEARKKTHDSFDKLLCGPDE